MLAADPDHQAGGIGRAGRSWSQGASPDPSGVDAQELVGRFLHEAALYVPDRQALMLEEQVAAGVFDADPLERVVLLGDPHLPVGVHETREGRD